MILLDTSVWVDHFRRKDAKLTDLLEQGQILMHPFAIGELAMGNLHPRNNILSFLHDLPQADVAEDSEVLAFVDRHKLYGQGIGYVDAHLLASAQLSSARLWTKDKILHKAAARLQLEAVFP